MTNNQTVTIFMLLQTFPCGPSTGNWTDSGRDSSAEKRSGKGNQRSQVEVVDVSNEKQMENHSEVISLISSFGKAALPVISVNNEVVYMGNAEPKEVISAIKKMGQTQSPGGCSSNVKPGCCG